MVTVLILGLLAVSSVPPLAAATSAARADSSAAAPKGAGVSAPRIPLRFEPCLPVTCGASSDWSYTGIGGHYRVLIGNKKIAFVQPGTKDGKPRVTTLEFVDPAADAKAIAGKRRLSEASYFTSSDPKQWHSHVPDYDSVTLQNAYPGIDFRFYENERQLEFDVQARPGADLSRIRLRVIDDSAHLLNNGDLQLGDGDVAFSIHIPAAYQVGKDEQKLPIAVKFSLTGRNEVTLTTDRLQSSLATVIDPTVAFSTFLEGTGASATDSIAITNVAVDGSGNIWVAGSSYGLLPDLSSTSGLGCTLCASTTYNAVASAAKFNSSGNLLVTVMLGGTTDLNVGMTLDTQGNLYLVGDTAGGRGVPTTSGAFDTSTGSYGKIFISKINSTGSTLVFSTFLGGSTGITNINAERGGTGRGAGAIQVDSLGDVFVGGSSAASDFPVTANAVQSTCGAGICTPLNLGGVNYDFSNGVLAELSPDGSKLLYGTYLGGSGSPVSTGYSVYNGGDISQIALASGKVIVTGSTVTTNFPVSPTAIHRTNAECGGAGEYAPNDSNFLASIDPTQSGSAGLVFSTFICEYVQSIAVDTNNNVYLGVTATVATNNTAATPGTFTPIYNDGLGASGPGIEEISADGSQVLKMSWLGLQYADLDYLVLDSNNDVYISGQEWIDSTGIPIVNSVQSSLGTATQCNLSTWQAQTASCAGIFLMELDSELDAPVFSTLWGPLGGSPNTNGSTAGFISVDQTGNIYGVGSTEQSKWPTTSGAYEPNFKSGTEGFLLKITGIPANPGVLLTTDHLFFGQTNYGSPVVQTVNLVNHSGSPMQISSVAGDGTDTDPLSASQNCVSTIAVGASCSTTVTFNPQQPGDLTGTITITDNSSTSPHVITGIGTGVMGLGVPASTSLDFASTPVGQSSAAQTLLFNNTGNIGLNVSNVSISGDFSETNNCSGGINVGTACAIEVTFTPTEGGSRTGTLSIADNGPGSPHLVALSGNASGPGILLSPTTLTFASQTEGTASAAQTVAISNPGSAALNFSLIGASGDFSLTNTCGASIAAGAGCTISVTFSPTAVGSRTGTVTISDNIIGSPQTVALSGTGVAATPTATPSPTSLTFASQTTGTTSAAQTVTLANSGQAALALSSIATSGDFAQTNTCGTSVAAGANCSISVKFTPTAAGSRAGTLTITDNATGSPQTVTLSGTGVAATPTATLSPTSLTFASQTDGSTSTAQTMTLTNSGTAALNITSIAASGDFAQTNNCGTSVAANAGCTISVTFTPTAAGSRTGTLTITDNVSGSPQALGLSGTGLAATPTATFSPISLTFASQTTGTTSAAQAVTLTNSGTAALALSSIAASGDFSETTNCGTSVAVGANCTISIIFTPTAAGSRTGTLTITDNATGSPQSVTLNGTGVAATPTATLSPTSLTFLSQTTGTTSAAQTVTLTNSGTAALTLGAMAVSGDFSETNTCGLSVAAAATCTISIAFTPTAAGTRAGNLTITDNATGSPQTLALSGTGANPIVTAPAATLSTTSLTFAPQTEGTTSAAQTVTLTNSGTAALTIASIAASGDFAETNTCGASLEPVLNFAPR
jgi:hypothetical protein